MVSPSLSHHRGFVVAIAMSPSSSHCCGVVVTVASLRCLHCRIVAVLSLLSWCHFCHCIVAVLSSPSWCCLRICHSFVVAVVVSPSCWSWFCHRRRGVAFVVALSRFHCRSRVVAVPLLSHRCSFIAAVAVSPSLSHCCSVRCHFIIAVVVSPSSLHRHGVIVAVLLSLLQCRFRCRIVITLWCHRCSHVVAWSWSWSWSWSHHGCGHHGRGCGRVVVVTVVVASLWSLLLRCGRCC